jgi:hypothetical protein
MRKTLQTALICSSVIYLAGCASADVNPRRYTQMQLTDAVQAPATPPGIIAQQNATVYYASGEDWIFRPEMANRIAQSWRKAGLFKNVEVTSNRVPSAQGYAIQTHCVGYVRTAKDGGIMDVAFIMTAGALAHSAGWDRWSCDSTIFQNGSKVSASSSKWDFEWYEGGWGGAVTLPQASILENGFNSAAQHMVTRDLVALKKAYP